MIQLLEALISGATIGSVYFIIAVGFSLIYGVSRVLVYSYGSFFTWGAYFAWIFAVGVLELNYVFVFIFVIPLMALMGFALEKLVVQPLRKRPAFDWNVLLATLGVALFLDNLALVVFGARTKSLPLMIDGTISVGRLVLSNQQVFMFLFSIALAVVLSLLLSKTRIGMAMRAVAQDSEGGQDSRHPDSKDICLYLCLMRGSCGPGRGASCPEVLHRTARRMGLSSKSPDHCNCRRTGKYQGNLSGCLCPWNT